MTTTPPARPIVEPPTPLHGARSDDNHLYSVRKSSRISNRASNRTPSPAGSERLLRSPRASSPRRSSRKVTGSHTYSPPSSNPSSPEAMSRKRSHSGTLSAKKPLAEELLSDPLEGPSGMLPTPIKTPRKKELKDLKPVSRALFSNRLSTAEEAMPKPNKRARRHLGYSLQSFEDSPTPDIEIYTDSKEHRPEVDESEENPFYVKPGTKKRVSRRGKEPSISGANQRVQEVLERDEGMVYVFRGKKIYRRFDGEDEELPHGLESTAEGLDLERFETPRHFTRSSVKPRLLFPNANLEATSLTDEEALTDIEEQASSELQTATPTKHRFAPATPPDTNRAKRTVKKAMDILPAADHEADLEAGKFTVTRSHLKRGGRSSPFDSWQRLKPGQKPTSKKRGGDELERSEEGKKVKN